MLSSALPARKFDAHRISSLHKQESCAKGQKNRSFTHLVEAAMYCFHVFVKNLCSACLEVLVVHYTKFLLSTLSLLAVHISLDQCFTFAFT